MKTDPLSGAARHRFFFAAGAEAEPLGKRFKLAALGEPAEVRARYCVERRAYHAAAAANFVAAHPAVRSLVEVAG
jgi:hypothetical protein